MQQVRAATGTADLRPGGGRFGTALTPARNPLAQSVWQDDIAFVSTADAQGQDDPRTLAVLLDFVASRSAAPAAHLLDDSYRAMFTPAEMTLRDRLRDLRAALDEHRLDLPSAVVEAFDDALGRIAAQAPA